MENGMENQFNLMLEKYKAEKHEFDEASLKLIHEVFVYGYNAAKECKDGKGN